MYKKNLEQFLATQLTNMRNLHNDKDCLYRIYNQAFGACSFVNDSLYYDAGDGVECEYLMELEWLVELWHDFQDKVREEFKLDV